MTEIKHVASKLAKVMAACRYVHRDRRNDFLKYNYVSAAAILEKVNAACVEQNLATIVVSKILGQTEKTNRSGAIETLITIQTDVTLVDCDSGESLTFTGLGSGQDVGDKAVAKAQTMALKYAWMTTLNISTGEDPEADTHNDEIMAVAKVEKCPSCGSTANLVETEEVVGKIVGIYRCSENKHQYRKPLTVMQEKAIQHQN